MHPSSDVASSAFECLRGLFGRALLSIARAFPQARRVFPQISYQHPMHVSAFRIVVLMNDSNPGRQILAGLAERGITPVGVIFESPHELRYCRRARSPLGRFAETPLACARSVWRRIRARRLLASHVPRGTRRLVTASRNNEKTIRFVSEVGTDLLVLAGVGLVSRDVLASPRYGCLNAHPGLVPWVRGNGAVSNAILRGVAVGASCHWVDAGIDTGAVIARRLLAIRGGEALELLEQQAVHLASRLMLDVLSAAVLGGGLPLGNTQQQKFPLCHWQDARGRAVAAELLLAGRALELYARWGSLCKPGTDDLPDDISSANVPEMHSAPSGSDTLQSPA